MQALIPPPAPSPEQKLDLLPQPTFVGALRGVCLLAWKGQLRWGRLPLGLLSLLILPVLVYMTCLTPRMWVERHGWVGNPVTQLDSLSRRLDRAQAPLKPEQQTALLRIFAEEYAQAEREWRKKQFSEEVIPPQAEHIKAAHERIRSRAQDVLESAQYTHFKNYEKRKLEESLGKVKESKWGRAGPFYLWLISFYFLVILPLSCVRSCGALIRDELQADTLGFLTTRPLSRARLLVLKYLSQTAWLEGTLLIETLLLFAAGQLREMPALGALLPLFLATQFLAVLAWSALGTFLGQVTKRYIALALVYGFIVEMGIGQIPTNINTLSLMRHLKTLLAANPTVQKLYEWVPGGAPISILALVLATVFFLTLAALLFTFKEYHPSAEMQR